MPTDQLHSIDGAPLTEARFTALLAATSDVVYRMSADWSELQPLDGRDLVASSAEPVSEWLQRHIPADEHARVTAAIAAAIATRSVFDLEHRVFAPGGGESWVHSRAVPVVDASGAIVEWFGLARDVTQARQFAEALRESEQRFRSVFEQSTGGIAQVDLSGQFVLVNDRYCEIVGRSREQLLGMRMQDITHPEELGGNVSDFGLLAKGLVPGFTIQKRYLRPDGSTVWVQNDVSATRGVDGTVRYITAVVADVTRLRVAEANQSALAAQRQLALDAAGLGWWQFDPESGLVFFDHRYAQVYGLEAASPCGVADIDRLVHPDDAARLDAAIDVAVDPRDPQPFDVEYRITRPDGRMRWLEARGIAAFEGPAAQRKLTSFVGTVSDVTARHEAEQLLRENEARFRLMADASPASLWVTDSDGHCTFLSRAWYEFTGQAGDEALGLGWTQAIHPDDAEQVGREFVQANDARKLFRTEYRLRAADGTYHWAIDLGRPWFSETGAYAGMIGVVFDIDARKRAEHAVAQANRRKDEFLATLAHELRNPLAPISNALQVWPLVEHQPAEARRLREMMERQVRQMVRLIDDLLDVSRITRGAIALKKEPLDLASAIGTAVEAVRPFMDAHRHELVLALPATPLLMDADHGRMIQVIGNLLNNAAKYTGSGGRIWLTGGADGNQAVVIVRDNGIGIPRDMLAAVFDMFTQVDQALGRAHGGLGIGLTLVKSLVELHGGTIEARSEGDGKGSEFVVRLPLSTDPSAAVQLRQAHRPTLPSPRSRRVLVVDDVVPSANTLSLMLQQLGQEPRAVYDGASALAALEEFRPDIAFVDIAMPGMDGYEVARRIRDVVGQGMVLVALTGFGQEDDRRRALAAGFDHHLVKPTTIEALYDVLMGEGEGHGGPR